LKQKREQEEKNHREKKKKGKERVRGNVDLKGDTTVSMSSSSIYSGRAKEG